MSGETAQHITDNHLQTPKTHPLKHLRIQRLAAKVKDCKKSGGKCYTVTAKDNITGSNMFIAADIYPKFGMIVTA